MAVLSTSANTPIDVSSRALILIGAEPITSFEDGTSEALVAGNMYEDIARSALVNCRWRFATNQSVLNRLSNSPTGRYTAAYQIPSDSLMLHAVTVNDFNIEYQTYGDKIFCDTSDTSEVVLDYTFRASEQDWPSYFVVAVQFELASVFASSLAQDASLAQLMGQQAQLTMMRARTLDSQQQTTRKLSTSRFIAERRS
jgi:hypothetical protein